MGLTAAWCVAPCHPWPVASVYLALPQPVWRPAPHNPHSMWAHHPYHQKKNMSQLGLATCVQPWHMGQGGTGRPDDGHRSLRCCETWRTPNMHMYKYVVTSASKWESCCITIPTKVQEGCIRFERKTCQVLSTHAFWHRTMQRPIQSQLHSHVRGPLKLHGFTDVCLMQ